MPAVLGPVAMSQECGGTVRGAHRPTPDLEFHGAGMSFHQGCCGTMDCTGKRQRVGNAKGLWFLNSKESRVNLGNHPKVGLRIDKGSCAHLDGGTVLESTVGRSV